MTVNKSTLTTEQKLRTKLRLNLSRIDTIQLCDNKVREHLRKKGWVPETTVIPCEWDTPFQEIFDVIDRRKQNGESSFLIPLIVQSTEEPKFSIKMLLITNESSDSFWSLSLDEIYTNYTMQDIYEDFTPDKTWTIEEISESQSQDITRLLNLINIETK